MKTRKFLALALALIMAFAMIPVASLAENVDGLVNEAAAMRKLDNAWAALDAAEADALSQGQTPAHRLWRRARRRKELGRADKVEAAGIPISGH